MFDAGHAVYFANLRGTTNSRKTIGRRPAVDRIDASENEQAFWDFSYDTIAQYDIPATVRELMKDYKNTYDSCKGLQVVAFSFGANALLISMAQSYAHKEYIS